MNKSELKSVIATGVFEGSWRGSIDDGDGKWRNIDSNNVYRDQQFGEERCIGSAGSSDADWQFIQLRFRGDVPEGNHKLGAGYLIEIAYLAPGQDQHEIATDGAVRFARISDTEIRISVQHYQSDSGRKIECHLNINGPI